MRQLVPAAVHAHTKPLILQHLTPAALATTELGEEGDAEMMGSGSGIGGGWMWLLSPVILMGIVLLVTFLARAVGGGEPPAGRRSSPRPGHADQAEQILRERFATGELTSEEFQAQLQVLRTDRTRNEP